jgi:hypothetical protein
MSIHGFRRAQLAFNLRRDAEATPATETGFALDSPHAA